ncbi:MAG: 23S rRNA (guanosine(2251)-2'-O)-methyltransferase RlmB [Verrucomicrobiota bacterium]|nr:23S rRNA (guanosine(2251)-2'-O)-methyltransferase RlmB [Verrucomicrobiota bacterium]
MLEIIYGRRPVHEALRAGRRRIEEILFRDSVKPCSDIQAIERLAQSSGIRLKRMSEGGIDALTGGANHQGVAARGSAYPYEPLDAFLKALQGRGAAPFVLALDHLQDPQNVGAILRTAEAVGVDGVVIPKDRAAEITPAVVRASAGASEHVRVARVTNLVMAMKELQECGVWFAGLDLSPRAKPYTEVDLSGSVGLVVGNEGHGLGRLARETCDFLMFIPMAGRVASLNAAVAAAVALYEARRQRSLKSAASLKS